MPRGVVKTQLVEIILHRQATDLNERASRALQQLRGSSGHASAHQTGSSSSQTGGSSSGNEGSGTFEFPDGGHAGSAGVSAEQVRAEVKRQKVRQSHTSGIRERSLLGTCASSGLK